MHCQLLAIQCRRQVYQISIRTLFKQNEKDIHFVNALRRKKHQLNVVVVLSLFVMSIPLNVFFLQAGINKEYHINNIFSN